MKRLLRTSLKQTRHQQLQLRHLRTPTSDLGGIWRHLPSRSDCWPSSMRSKGSKFYPSRRSKFYLKRQRRKTHWRSSGGWRTCPVPTIKPSTNTAPLHKKVSTTWQSLSIWVLSGSCGWKEPDLLTTTHVVLINVIKCINYICHYTAPFRLRYNIFYYRIDYVRCYRNRRKNWRRYCRRRKASSFGWLTGKRYWWSTNNTRTGKNL